MLKGLGAMRVTLYLFVLAFLPMVLGADAEPVGFGFVTAYLAPTLIVLFFFVLMLDALMCRVFSAEQPEEIRAVNSRRIRINFLLAALILLVWGPFFYQLTQV